MAVFYIERAVPGHRRGVFRLRLARRPADDGPLGPDLVLPVNLVWDAMARAYESASGDLAERLLVALETAQGEGGDPIFCQIFGQDRHWWTLTQRLPASGLLPDDPELMQKILATGEGDGGQ